MAKNRRDKDTVSFKEATINMSSKEKLSYIWEYYKWIILGSITATLMIVSIAHTMLTRTHQYLNIMFTSGFEHTLNAFGQPDLDEEAELVDLPEPPLSLWVDFDIASILEDLLIDEKQLNNNYEILVQHLALNVETIPVFTTHAGAGVLDIIVTSIPDLQAMAEIGHFKNIFDLGLDIDAHKMHNEYAIYLRHFPIFNNYVMAEDDLVLGISATTANIENIKNFFNLLLE